MSPHLVLLAIDNLRELADRHLQEALWVRGTGGQQSSVEEAVCGLFDDTGLSEELVTGDLAGQFGAEVQAALQELNARLHELMPILLRLRAEEIIRHPEMTSIRTLAQRALDLWLLKIGQ